MLSRLLFVHLRGSIGRVSRNFALGVSDEWFQFWAAFKKCDWLPRKKAIKMWGLVRTSWRLWSPMVCRLCLYPQGVVVLVGMKSAGQYLKQPTMVTEIGYTFYFHLPHRSQRIEIEFDNLIYMNFTQFVYVSYIIDLNRPVTNMLRYRPNCAEFESLKSVEPIKTWTS